MGVGGGRNQDSTQTSSASFHLRASVYPFVQWGKSHTHPSTVMVNSSVSVPWMKEAMGAEIIGIGGSESCGHRGGVQIRDRTMRGKNAGLEQTLREVEREDKDRQSLQPFVSLNNSSGRAVTSWPFQAHMGLGRRFE